MGTLDLKKWLLGSTLLIGASAVAFAPAAYAQDDADDVAVIEEADEEADEDDGDTVIVTGSRIKRDEFTSISPIQVISGEVARDLGLVEADEILRTTTVVQGQQTDLGVSTVLQGGLGQAFTTFGSVTPSLRGLASSVTGRSRNLVLVNGRRLGPVGVGGAPANPDVSLIPGSLISRVDLLLDGASSIYGSDAIAGVINYQLRSDFEGFELDAFYDESNVGDENMTLSATAGISSDRGYTLVAAEYRRQQGYRRIDRFGEYLPFIDTAFGPVACDPEREINTLTGEVFSGCNGGLAGFSVFGDFGTAVVTPGETNIGVPNYSAFGIAPFDGPESAGTFGNTVFNPFTQFYPQDQQAYVAPPVERFSIYTLGEYEVDLPTSPTLYYELSYAERNLQSNTFAQSVIETDENTPFNPGLGASLLVGLIQIDFDQTVDVFRATGGVKGDLTAFEKIGLDGWEYDAYALFHRSKGTQTNFGDLNTTNMARVLNGSFDSNNQFQCALDESIIDTQPTSGTTSFTTAPTNCFAVNFFDPQFLLTGRFSDPASNDLILTTALQNTRVDQVTVNGFISGELFDLPAGAVEVALGGEYRFDEVQTRNDFFQSTPNALFTLNPDVGSSGSRDLLEIFGEVVIPILEDKPFAERLQIELAGRLIEEEFFGRGDTYQVKGLWEPTDWLQISAGHGTSFRAPDTGEQFGTGIIFAQNTRTDPCLPPTAVLNDIDGDGDIDYDSSLDERQASTIALCEQLGIVYPADGDSQATIDQAAALGLFGIGSPSGSFQSFSVLFGNSGNTDVTPETSEASFVKVSVVQPWFEQFDLRFSANYYEYEVNDSIGQLTSGVILSSCFNDPNTAVVNGELQGDLCQFQERNPATGLLSSVNESSFNLGSITSRGIDYNVEFYKDLDFINSLPVFGEIETPELGIVYRATDSFENAEDISGDGSFDDLLNTYGFPEFQQNITTTLSVGNWSFLHRYQYADATDSGLAPFGGGNVCAPTLLERDANADTSGCTEFITLPDLELHDFSVTYNADSWAFRAGIRNAFDEVPVLDHAIPSDADSGTPFGLGYDANGRNFFFNISKSL
ncbi:MAG: TonB-dependent receptor [Aquisalinus sp.]|nr:TonB-dependent receptor [Aquisalinus sp.]